MNNSERAGNKTGLGLGGAYPTLRRRLAGGICAVVVMVTALAFAPPAGALGPGDIVTHAGGSLGEGPATNTAVPAEDVAVAGSRMYSTEGPRIRLVDLQTGDTRVVAGRVGGFKGDGGPATKASLSAGRNAVAVDGAGNLFVADYWNMRIRKIVPGADGVVNGGADEIITTVAGSGFYEGTVDGRPIVNSGDGGPATSATLANATGVEVDSAGSLLITVGGYRIRRVVPGADRVINGGSDEIITTVAGNGTQGFSGDGGRATEAQLGNPNNPDLDAAGNLLFSDGGNRRIRKVVPGADRVINGGADEIITTVAGIGENPSGCRSGCAANATFLPSPGGIMLDRRGNLFIGDSGEWPANDSKVFKVAAGSDGVINGDEILTTVAGSGNGGFSGDGGPATSAKLFWPDAGVDASGNLIIADTRNFRVRRVVTGADGVINGGADEIITTVAGNGSRGYGGDGGPATRARVQGAGGLAVDRAGNVFFADIDNHRIRKVDTAGVITTVAGSGVDSDADWYGSRSLFGGDGGPATSALISHPQTVKVDASGNLFIADAGNHRIRKVVPGADGVINGRADEIITTVAGSGPTGGDGNGFGGDGGPATSAQLCAPYGVGLDTSGRIFIADLCNNRIRKVDTNGIITTIAGTGPQYPESGSYGGDGAPAVVAQLWHPNDVTVDPAGNVIFSDFGNRRVRKIDTKGIITTVAGNGTLDTVGNGGPATSASLHGPRGVSMDTSGNLFIAEAYGYRIRKVDAAGIITTVAGDGTLGYDDREGVPATSARLTAVPGVGVDTSGNIFLADSAADRIRKVLGSGVKKAAVADFTGDAHTDISVFRPSNGTWYVKGLPAVAYGTNGDVPVPADYDGNGTTDIAVFRPSNGAWYVKGALTVAYGTNGDVPVPADYDGNGTTDIAVFRPSNGTWYVKGAPAVAYGTNGDVPVAGDYNGDGKADIAVFRPSNGTWYVKGAPAVAYGTSGDVPVPADYDGNGTTDIAVFRPSNGAWYVKGAPTVAYGTNGDVPVPGDYNGDRKADIAVFRPSNGAWYVRGITTATYGTNGDIPLPLAPAIRLVFFSPRAS